MQTFKQEGTIQADLVAVNRRGRKIVDWLIKEEKTACDSCLICNHYKLNYENVKLLKGTFVHICLYRAPEFIDITEQLKYGFNQSCQFFSRRSIER